MIIVFGGAFNPPTIAHKEIYYLIKKHVDFERFLYLPVSNKYHKSSLIDDHYRVDMLNLLIKDLDLAKICLIEVNDSKYLGTYKSLLRIKSEYKRHPVAFVIGSDNLLSLNNWINAKMLIAKFKFIVIKRDEDNVEEIISNNELLNAHAKNFKVIPGLIQTVSSSAFRKSLDPAYVTDEIFQYITKNNLYRGNKNV